MVDIIRIGHAAPEPYVRPPSKKRRLIRKIVIASLVVDLMIAAALLGPRVYRSLSEAPPEDPMRQRVRERIAALEYGYPGLAQGANASARH